jgi:hypothetical protein
MKKIYSKPQVEEINVNAQDLIATSIPKGKSTSEDGVTDADSKGYDGEDAIWHSEDDDYNPFH